MFEFALVAGLIFIPLMFGIIEFGRATWAKNMVTAAAREGVRYAIVHGNESSNVFDSAAVADTVKSRIKLSPISVGTAWTGKDQGDTVTVTVRYSYVPIVRIIPGRMLTATSRQIIAY